MGGSHKMSCKWRHISGGRSLQNTGRTLGSRRGERNNRAISATRWSGGAVVVVGVMMIDIGRNGREPRFFIAWLIEKAANSVRDMINASSDRIDCQFEDGMHCAWMKSTGAASLERGLPLYSNHRRQR